MKKLIALILICSMFFTACSKMVSEEYLDVTVTVVDSHYSSEWMQMIPIGDAYTFITYDAEYYIYVTYEGQKYSINNEDTYNKYKDKIGEDVKAILAVEKYENSTIKNRIILK